MGLFDQIMSSASGNAAKKTGLDAAWTKDRVVTISMPETAEELKAAVDVTDPGCVAAYWAAFAMAAGTG